MQMRRKKLGSKAFQRIALWMGLDANHDGRFDWRDLVHWVIAQIDKESADEYKQQRKQNPTIQDLHDRLIAIESLIRGRSEEMEAQHEKASGSQLMV